MLNDPESERKRLLELAEKQEITEDDLLEGAQQARGRIVISLIQSNLKKGYRINFPGSEASSSTRVENNQK